MVLLLLGGCLARDRDGDGWTGIYDCDDGDPDVFLTNWAVDADGDGYGAEQTTFGCDGDGFVPSGGPIDCDDADPDVFPGAPERCNRRDDDCDYRVDEDAIDPVALWTDQDGDGYGGLPTRGCIGPGFADRGGDCRDDWHTFHPGAPDDPCSGSDVDCDGIDSTTASTWWRDGDGDGYGDPAGPSTSACSPGPGWVPTANDCDDADPDEHPGAVWYLDGDGDGHGVNGGLTSCRRPADRVTPRDDCDDANPQMFPGAAERCGDAIDQDCSSIPDDPTPWWPDADGDGWGAPGPFVVRCEPLPGWASADGDCNDTDAGVSPGASDVVGEGVDRNCDGLFAPPLDPVAVGGGRSDWMGDAAGAGLGDLDGDGLDDIVVYDESYLAVLLGGGPDRDLRDGDLVLRGSYREGLAITIADLVGDPAPDLVIGNGRENTVRVYDGARRGGIAGDDADAVLSGWGPHYAGDAVAPYGDGRLAIAVPGANAVHLLDGPVSGWTAIADAPTRLLARRGSMELLVAEDFDGDGLPDLLGAGDEDVWLVTEAPTGTMEVADVAEVWVEPTLQRALTMAGDIDQDGLPDLAWREDGAYLRMWSPASGALGQVEAGDVPTFTGAGDLDGDGRDELIASRYTEAGHILVVIDPPTSGSWPLDDVTLRTGSAPPGQRFSAWVTAAGDVDGDRRGDVLATVEGGWLLVSP